MAITYEWDINGLEVMPSSASLSDVVHTIVWSYSASTGSFSQESRGSINPLSALGSVASSDFVAYNSLTKPLVVGWVTASLGDVYTGSLEDRMSAAIANDMEPPIISKDIPW